MKVITDRAERILRSALENARTQLQHAARGAGTQREALETSARDCQEALTALHVGGEHLEVELHVRG